MEYLVFFAVGIPLVLLGNFLFFRFIYVIIRILIADKLRNRVHLNVEAQDQANENYQYWLNRPYVRLGVLLSFLMFILARYLDTQFDFSAIEADLRSSLTHLFEETKEPHRRK